MTQAIFKKRALNDADIAMMQQHHVWKGEGPIGPDRLAHLTLTYMDFDAKTHYDGEMMVMDVAADAAISIFSKLYEMKFPIYKIALMSEFDGDDNKAMAANTSNAFISRNIAGKKLLSLHAYGLAIDVNQVQNPMVSFEDDKEGNKLVFLPKESNIGYLNRATDRPGKPPRPGMVEPVVPIFRDHGFTVWGGDWDVPLDYHHFNVSRPLAKLLAATDYATGKKLFDAHVAYYRKNKADWLGAIEKDGVDVSNIDAVRLRAA